MPLKKKMPGQRRKKNFSNFKEKKKLNFSFLFFSLSFLTNKHSKTDFFYNYFFKIFFISLSPKSHPKKFHQPKVTKSNINKLKPSQRSFNYFLNTISFLSNQTEEEYIINIIESFQQTQEVSAVKPRQNVNKNKMK